MSRRYLKLALLCALLHFAVSLVVAGLVFLLSAVPPKAANVDGLILALWKVQFVLAAPRKLFLWLWPGESTPGILSLLATLFNSTTWGCGLAGLRMIWQRITA